MTACCVDLSVSATPGLDSNTSSQFGSNESVTVLPTNTDPLYVRVYSYDPSTIAEPVPFTLTAEEGDAAATLEAGQSVWGNVAAGGSVFHLIEVPEANVFVTVYLYGATDQDLDLRATVTDDTGASLTSLSSSGIGSTEVIADFVETPSTWQIEVDGSYVDSAAPYALVAQVLSANAVTGQWAIDAVASSEYGTDGYSALQATGEPNVLIPADDPLAWTAAEPDAGEETLDMTFAQPVVPSGIAIHESYMPGAVVAVAALDLNSNEWVTLWEGKELTSEESRVFSPELTSPDFATDQIRLILDTSIVDSWNEIDAVQLFGLPAVE